MKHLLLLLALISTSISFAQKKQTNESEEVPFVIIEKVPVYPNCQKWISDNVKLKKCMSNKISDHVSKKFNTRLAKRLSLPEGNVKIQIYFKINRKGKVVAIKASAPHRKLEKEAVRVIKLLPDMVKPGFHKGKPVTVPYALPILFAVTK